MSKILDTIIILLGVGTTITGLYVTITNGCWYILIPTLGSTLTVITYGYWIYDRAREEKADGQATANISTP